jgi:hypothetical protein
MGNKSGDRAPLWRRLRTPVLSVVGLGSAGVVAWLGLAGFSPLSLVPITIVGLVGAVLFSSRDEPSQRLERLIKLIRRAR